MLLLISLSFARVLLLREEVLDEKTSTRKGGATPSSNFEKMMATLNSQTGTRVSTRNAHKRQNERPRRRFTQRDSSSEVSKFEKVLRKQRSSRERPQSLPFILPCVVFTLFILNTLLTCSFHSLVWRPGLWVCFVSLLSLNSRDDKWQLQNTTSLSDRDTRNSEWAPFTSGLSSQTSVHRHSSSWIYCLSAHHSLLLESVLILDNQRHGPSLRQVLFRRNPWDLLRNRRRRWRIPWRISCRRHWQSRRDSHIHGCYSTQLISIRRWIEKTSSSPSYSGSWRTCWWKEMQEEEGKESQASKSSFTCNVSILFHCLLHWHACLYLSLERQTLAYSKAWQTIKLQQRPSKLLYFNKCLLQKDLIVKRVQRWKDCKSGMDSRFSFLFGPFFFLRHHLKMMAFESGQDLWLP